MSDIKVKQLYRKTEDYAGQTVTVRGWVRNNRNSNAFGFIELNDGSFFKPVQIVYDFCGFVDWREDKGGGDGKFLSLDEGKTIENLFKLRCFCPTFELR